MSKQISIYLILLLTLAAISFFLTSNIIDQKVSSQDNLDLEIFQAKDINLNLNFFESNLKMNLKSSMLNGLANSSTLKVYKPKIYITDSEINVEIYSDSAELNYKSNEFVIPDSLSFKGEYQEREFYGNADKLIIDFSKNTFYLSENFIVTFDGREYSGKNIFLDLNKKTLINSEKINIKDL
jgi:lipopolysaccharide export system protein LptA